MRLPEDLKTPCSFAAIVLICAFAVITFYRLGNRPLQDYDEAIYAQVAHEAMQSGNQLGFTWLGNPPLHRTEMWFEKPPVMLWLTELSYAAFGVNEFAARFWTAILAIFTLPLTFLFARDLANAAGVAGGGPAGARPRDFSSRAALLSVVSFFAAFQFSDDARIMQMDIPAGFFVLLAMFGFWRARERFGFHFLFWTALAGGLLVKSVIGLLPLPILFIFSVLARDFRYLQSRNFWLGFLVFLALILPWHLVESLRYGKEFWHQYLFYHLLERYSSALEGNSGPFSFYLVRFLREPLFFWALLPALIYFAAKSFQSKPHLLVTVAVLFIFLFFSTAGTKLPPYILVIYPFAALALGLALADLAAWREKFKAGLGNLFVAALLVAFLVSGFRNARVNLAQENDPQLVSDKAVGEFLKTNCLDEPAYYYSVNRLKPSIIFYSDRMVGYFADYEKTPPAGKFVLIAPKPPDRFADQSVLYSAATEQVYQIGH